MSGIKRDKYDKMFSNLVRAGANWRCQRCGTYFPPGPGRCGLHLSHVFSRRKQATRFNWDNGWSLCYGCHQHFSENPKKHYEWVTEQIGEERFFELKRLSNTRKKWKVGEKEELYQRMKSEYARIEP